ncbi:NUDIX domain-containing protein [Pelagicoccus sp. SDUM812003]|uniref:NUDIX hydrolase n=1 Tax=Pelagicoccus sp. SDUM812003 TaxID=3041267 RepID=UPI00280FA177|nr:NUDIX domain-containing protein [Pelagicoccus sp. SDUM812003]MDQ8201983.1 NUDIX domain-containing protein [Pelagicoccus sp. SDUM812003]
MLDLKRVEAAGGLTVDDQERVLFIFKDGRWDLPKGLVERKQSPEETALSEVSEETGLSAKQIKLVCELIPTSHISKYAKTKSLKTTRWFLLRYLGSESRFQPQTEEGIEHCEWIPTWDLERPLANCPARIRYLVSFWLKARRHIRGDLA